jgi:hypothetical protein
MTALVSAFPGADVHEVPATEFPGEVAPVTVPVVLPLTAPRIITGVAGGKTSGGVVIGVVGAAGDVGIVVLLIGLMAGDIGLDEALVFVEVALITDGETVKVDAEQFTLVPGMVGFSASGGAAKVVAGAPETVAGENRLVNGPGPPRGDDTIAPGVVGIAICVVPKVETCARELPPPKTSIVITQKKVRMWNLLRRANLANCSRTRGLGLRCHSGSVSKVHHRIKHDQIAGPESVLNQNLLSKVACDDNLLQVNGPVPDDRDVQPILIKHDRVGRHHEGRRFPRDKQVHDTIDSGTEHALRIRHVDFGQQRAAARL